MEEQRSNTGKGSRSASGRVSSSWRATITPSLLLSLLALAALLAPYAEAADSDDLTDSGYFRPARAPKLIRFGRSGPKLIRFGKRSENTPPEDSFDNELNEELLEAAKRGGPKVIRFG